MDFDIESTIQDNIRLKKALQMARFQSQKFQKQSKEFKQLYEEQQNRNNSLKADYHQLNRKYQQSFTQSIKDNNSLISQIDELKNIIEQKQRDMQQLQIKLIPSLDQDMLRVKLITQMQGPYQDVVDKKNTEIQRLKQKITQLQRNLQITSLGLKSKVNDLKKQNGEIKLRYEEENSRLMQELNLSLSRNQSLSVETSIIKNQKKQIEQLKKTLEFVTQNQQKHLNQIKELKEQRKQMLEKLMMLNSKQALLLQGKHNMTEIQKLKEQRLKNIREIQSFKSQNDKLNRQINKLQQQKTKLTNEYQKQLNFQRNNFTQQRNQLNNELYNLKQQLKRLKNSKIQDQSSISIINQKYRVLQKQLYNKQRQIETLKLQNSRFSYHGSELRNDVQKKSPIQKHLEQQKQQHQKQNKNIILNIKKHGDSSRQSQRLQNKLNQMKKQNDKLKSKLSEANQKILELIRDKLKHGKQPSPQRDRTLSNIDRPRGVFLEYEDCAFKPLIEPTLYTYCQTRK